MIREDYSFDVVDEVKGDKVLVLIIYDIVDNKKRIKFAKYLQGYGNRVQKSAFEAHLSQKKYTKLLREIPGFVSGEDSVRVYRITGKGQITAWGIRENFDQEDIILI